MEANSADLFDLPPPARNLSSTREELLDAHVVVHLANGKITRGKLKLLSYARENMLLDTDDGPVLISFQKILYLSFTQKLSVENSDSTQSFYTAQMPFPFQTFKLCLVNNEIVNGKMKSAFIDKGGIHVFKYFDAHHVVRLFFPAAAVAHYELGERLGEALVKKSKIKSKALDQALSAQKGQRKKKLGDYLLDSGVISSAQLKNALEIQEQELAVTDGELQKRKLGEILVAEGAVTQQKLDSILAKQEENRSKRLGQYLIDMGVAETEDIQVELARKVGLPFVRIEAEQVDSKAVSLVPRKIAQKYHLFPMRIEEGKLLIAIDDPFYKEALDTVHFVTNKPIELAIASSQSISAAIKRYYDEVKMHQDIEAAESVHRLFRLDSEQEQELVQIDGAESGAPIVRVVTRFIMEAIHKRASDIHIRPKKEDVDLLYRIDGELVKIRSFSKSLLGQIISRIKIIGKMDIAERRLPQDGAAQMRDGDNEVDLRISIIPTVEGESSVIRLLNSQAGLKSISELGFNKLDAEKFADMMHKSYGLVLVTGPTGSGKSTTLYAALKEVIARNLNIITVENPVEYRISGIEQIQVNTVPGYTFAKALRHILRHDPDVIMIGEIRDEETSKIAVESALTGHLVLSTLHTNDSAGSITRLLEMGVDPFLLNGTLLGVFAQRLVRRNCVDCLDEEAVDSVIRKVLDVPENETFYKGQGCEKCRGSGCSGRIAANELLQFGDDMKRLLHSGISTQEVHEQAVKDGMVPLTANALALARSKITSLEEVYRVRLD